MKPPSASCEPVFAILHDLVHQHGKTVIAMAHDVELAVRMDRRLHLVDGRFEGLDRGQ